MEVILSHIGNTFTRTNESQSKAIQLRRFKSFFGVTPYICVLLWQYITFEPALSTTSPSHLLWALFFLKCYTTEDISRAIFDVDSKTFRSKVWILIKFISTIPNVSLYIYLNLKRNKKQKLYLC